MISQQPEDFDKLASAFTREVLQACQQALDEASTISEKLAVIDRCLPVLRTLQRTRHKPARQLKRRHARWHARPSQAQIETK